MIDIFHLSDTCGRPAFKYDHRPSAGETIKKEHALHINGRPFLGREKLVYCESCGMPLMSGLNLAPSPMRVFDMSSNADMAEFYAAADMGGAG